MEVSADKLLEIMEYNNSQDFPRDTKMYTKDEVDKIIINIYHEIRKKVAYDSFNEGYVLIDDIDNMHHILFLLVFDRNLLDNDNYGIKSYQALWMRIQNEVVSARFNRFADIIDMDRYADEFYSAETLCEMSECLANALQKQGINVAAIGTEEVKELTERAQFGGLGLPWLINRTVVKEEKADV